MIRVSVAPPDNQSHAPRRIAAALVEHAPSFVEFAPWKQADLVVLHVLGRLKQTTELVDMLRARGKQYAVIQYCLRSTQQPDTSRWRDIWDGAKAVWSYVDLAKWVEEDGGDPHFPNLYVSPFGVDPEVFTHSAGPRQFLVATTGFSSLTESVREVGIAAGRADGSIFHLGPRLKLIQRHDVTFGENISDSELAERLGECQYVSGLRRIEGFELPAAEGLVCGARPILFDQPHYYQWYQGLAEFIPEGTRTEVVRSLEKLFQKPYQPVTPAERAEAVRRFDWNRVVSEFWERIHDAA